VTEKKTGFLHNFFGFIFPSLDGQKKENHKQTNKPEHEGLDNPAHKVRDEEAIKNVC